jgi:hypothetical protein
MPDNTEKKQGNNKFKKGLSGNPGGRPKGVRNKASLVAEQLFANDIKIICNSVIEQAKLGNMQAAKIILDRLLPSKKDAPISLELPKIENHNDILKAIGCITQAVANGSITPLEGEALARIVDIHAKALELYQYEIRLAFLEKQAEEHENF